MADINDNTINITISAPSADSNTISVVNPALKNNVVVNDARITPSERAKLAGIEAGATADQSIQTGDGLNGGDSSGDVTLSVDNTVVRTTGDQSISGVKTFSGSGNGITIDNQANVNFNQSLTTFGTGADVIFNAIAPKFRVSSTDFDLDGSQLVRKRHSGNFNIENQDLGNLSIRNSASGGTVFITSDDGDIIINAGDSGANDNKIKFYAREGIEFNLSSGGGSVSSPFKIIDNNPQAGNPSDIFTVNRNGDVTIRNANNADVFRVAVDPNNSYELDFIEIGGPSGYKFPKLDPNISIQNKALVVKDVAAGDPDFGKMEFRDFVATSIFDMSEVNETSTSIADGETLVWNDQTGKFVGQVALSDASLEDLSDVTLPATIPNNYALVWTGSTWEPQQQIDTNTNTTDLSTDNNPTLSADLDVNGNTITNELTDGGVVIRPNGNGDVTIGSTQGTGDVTIGNVNTPTVSLGGFNFDSNQSLTGKDNYVLTYDQSLNSIQLEPTALDLSGLSDVDTTGVSEGDVLVADASGDFSPSSAFDAFMTAAVSVSTGMPMNPSVAGDLDGDGLVTTADLLLFLANFGNSSYDGNTQIEFVDVPFGSGDLGQYINIPDAGAFGNQLDFTDYNTQTSVSDLFLLNIGSATTTTSISPYAWSVNNTVEQITLSVPFSSGELGEWFENASLSIESLSTINSNTFTPGNGGVLVPGTFALYAEVRREYANYPDETDNPVMLKDFGSVADGDHEINGDGPVLIPDIGKKDSTNTERPYKFHIKFYVGVADDDWGALQLAISNLKLKVIGPPNS